VPATPAHLSSSGAARASLSGDARQSYAPTDVRSKEDLDASFLGRCRTRTETRWRYSASRGRAAKLVSKRRSPYSGARPFRAAAAREELARPSGRAVGLAAARRQCTFARETLTVHVRSRAAVDRGARRFASVCQCTSAHVRRSNGGARRHTFGGQTAVHVGARSAVSRGSTSAHVQPWM